LVSHWRHPSPSPSSIKTTCFAIANPSHRTDCLPAFTDNDTKTDLRWMVIGFSVLFRVSYLLGPVRAAD